MTDPERQPYHLFASDFDGTVARTFDPSPNNMDVGRACALQIGDQFGPTVLAKYIRQGGLRNRAPNELIDDLFPGASETQRSADTDAFTAGKLNYLMDEIGSSWPKPIEGFPEFWEEVLELQRNTGLLDTAIISSGHTPFIEKVFTAWGLELPNIVISNDTLRELPDGHVSKDAVKPSPLLMQVVVDSWVQRRDNTIDLDTLYDRIIYTGDDAVKDGELAANSNVQFVHVTDETAPTAWAIVLQSLNAGCLAMTGAEVHGQ